VLPAGSSVREEEVEEAPAAANAGNSVAFFITEDEYLSMNNLNKEMETQKNSPVTQKNSKLSKKINEPDTYQSTSKILEKSKLFKEKSKFFDPVSSI
jgi:hypothetical protein